ncbi:MAG: AhpC/TSA family protein [Microscillaceae bacterium]|nr:AhpC/TSA family protein [Microscillaceae bacterium]MDW8460750.1 TlpA disulfide reductase family protein [Cytophagales bacterium]
MKKPKVALFQRLQLFLFIFILTLSACSSESQSQTKGDKNTKNQGIAKKIIISGTIKNPLKGNIVLERISGNSFQKVDSTQIKGDKFSLEVMIDEPDFYRLNLFGNKQTIMLVLNDENVNIQADAGLPNIPYTVSGSKDTEYFQQINQKRNEFQLKAEALNNEFIQAANNKEAQERIREKYMQALSQNATEMKALMEKMIPSIAIWYGLGSLNPDEDFEFLEKISQAFNQKLPHSKYTKQLAEQVAKLKPVAIGQPAPEIVLQNPEGKELKLSDLRGKVVLIDFWASWCKPCRMENPNVVKVYNKFKDKGFEIFGVSLDRTKEEWVRAIAEDQLTWLHVSDLKFWQSSVVPLYQVQGIPMTFLIDREGKIVAKNLRGAALEKKIAEILKM